MIRTYSGPSQNVNCSEINVMPMRFLILAAALALAQLSPLAADAAQSDRAQRSGTHWAVHSVGKDAAPRRLELPAATLFMGADGSLGGKWGCNGGGSPYARWTKAGGFTGTDVPIILTAMGCSDTDRSDFGGKFWRFMKKAQSWQRTGKHLIIYVSDGSSARLRLMSEAR
jgi:heat shock protein HslJ